MVPAKMPGETWVFDEVVGLLAVGGAIIVEEVPPNLNGEEIVDRNECSRVRAELTTNH
jgi:hypothetical protein